MRWLIISILVLLWSATLGLGLCLVFGIELGFDVESAIKSIGTLSTGLTAAVSYFGIQLRSTRRELEEETGLIASHWQSLGGVISSPGVFTEVIHLYLATGLMQGHARPAEAEVFEVVWLSLADAVQRATGGEIEDAKTLAGIWRASAKLQGS